MLKGKCMTGVRHFAALVLGIFMLLATVRAQSATPPPPPPAGCVARTSQTLPSGTRVTSGTIARPTPRPTPTPAPFEVRWLQRNIQLRNRIVNQAKAEVALTTNTVLKTFATNLSTTASLEASQMTTWLKTWYNVTPPTAPTAPAPAKDPVMVAMENQDLMFVNQVLLYEESSIGMAVFPATMATHAELKAFAKQAMKNGGVILELVESWQDILINIDLIAFFK